jgi:hypothetical protein
MTLNLWPFLAGGRHSEVMLKTMVVKDKWSIFGSDREIGLNRISKFI